MKTKIILGLGLCLLLTVINLHRAMDNYGITDAKFKVGVLADESSSSGGGASYNNIPMACIYTFYGLLPYECIELFQEHTKCANAEGDLVFTIDNKEIKCEVGGSEECNDINCEIPGGGDIWSITQGAEYVIVP